MQEEKEAHNKSLQECINTKDAKKEVSDAKPLPITYLDLRGRHYRQVELSRVTKEISLLEGNVKWDLAFSSISLKQFLVAMFGLTSGQIILLLGASAVLIGPKDMPVFARVAGKLAGKAVAQVQSVRSEMDGILCQSQASQVHKEIQAAISQLDAIRHEIRNATVINRAPHTRVSLSEEDESLIEDSVVSGAKKVEQETSEVFKKDLKAMKTDVTDFHQEANEFLKRASKAVETDGTDCAQLQSRAAAYSRLAEASKTQNNFSGVQFSQEQADIENTLGHTQIPVLPVSAESAGLLPKDRGTTGSDFVLEAILEANVAETAQEYFKEPEIQEKAKEYFSDPEIQEKMHTSDTSNKN